ncbi:type VII secretion target [Actinopolyspora mortivallis]|uniref:type VII secretion target n=1 Tax=Actinopolyspora mortivallis TaxID=33906 RepID=UPI00037DB398|nr:type VII secretion target [Actinopolyspora mortivallis]
MSSEGGGGYTVRTGELTRIGARSGELGSELLGLVRAVTEESTAAARAHRGWELADPLESVRHSCEHNIEGFGRWLDDLEDRLTAVARNYEETDEWALDKLRGSGV